MAHGSVNNEAKVIKSKYSNLALDRSTALSSYVQRKPKVKE